MFYENHFVFDLAFYSIFFNYSESDRMATYYPLKKSDLPRWKVEILYRTNEGFLTVTKNIEELSDLDDIIEGGPDWNTIHDISITLNRKLYPNLTIEQSLGDY